MAEYHKVILAEDFMAELAPEHWPPGKRIGFCYAPKGGTCEMKNGNELLNLFRNSKQNIADETQDLVSYVYKLHIMPYSNLKLLITQYYKTSQVIVGGPNSLFELSGILT